MRGQRRRSRPVSRIPRRDRRGRGMRGTIAPPSVPLLRTRSETFDDLVLDAVEELDGHWPAELDGVQFAVEDVPTQPADSADRDAVIDRGVQLGRLYRDGTTEHAAPLVVVYRRPVEARSLDHEDRADLVLMVVAELVADLLGKDLDELDP